MRETGQVDVIFGLDSQSLRELKRGVRLALENECLWHRAQIGVKNTDEAGKPRCGEFLVFLTAFQNGVEVGFHSVGHLVMGMFLFAVIQSFVCLFGHGAVFSGHLCDVREAASLREIGLASHAHVFLGLVDICVANHEHLRKVHVLACLAEYIVLKCGETRESPACARLVLVVDRTVGVDLYIGEFKTR